MQEGCTVYKTAQYLNKKWTLLIILELYKGNGYQRRFSELKDSLSGITPKILSERLKELEKEGLVKKDIDSSSFPVRSEYTLTECGIEMVDIIRIMKHWALKWKIENIACGEQDCKNCEL